MVDTKKIMVNGLEFEAPLKYAAGHVLTEVEAKALNQTLHENLRNNFASRVKAYLEGKEGAFASEAEMLAAWDSYVAEYDFAKPGVARAPVDPVEREAFKLAKDTVKAILANQGRKLTDIPAGLTKEEWEAKLQANYEKVAQTDEIIKAAKKAVNDRKKTLEAAAASLEI